MNRTPDTITPRHPFRLLGQAHELIAALAAPARKVARVDRVLAGQLRRAATSVPLNIAEGGRREGRDRLHHFRIAAGSADEVRSALWIALAWGYLERREVEAALALLDGILAQLWRLTHPR